MADGTGIQWTHVPGYRGDTWNPTTGCTRVSPGCDHCYAFQLHDQRFVAKRAGKAVSGKQYDKPFSQVQLLEERLTQPLRTKAPTAYFVDSMADLFHADVPDEYLDRVFATMAFAPWHIFMILTKRPERMRAYLSSADLIERLRQVERDAAGSDVRLRAALRFDRWADENWRGRAIVHAADADRWPLPNVWLGVSTEDQERADQRIPILLDTPAAVRFISAEPLIGPLNIGPYTRNARNGAALDWVIVGGESASPRRRARPFHVKWARSLRNQCAYGDAAFFLKQLGSNVFDRNDAGFDGEDESAWPEGTDEHVVGDLRSAYQGEPVGVHLRHHHGGNPEEWPADLQGCRAFPAIGVRA